MCCRTPTHPLFVTPAEEHGLKCSMYLSSGVANKHCAVLFANDLEFKKQDSSHREFAATPVTPSRFGRKTDASFEAAPASNTQATQACRSKTNLFLQCVMARRTAVLHSFQVHKTHMMAQSHRHTRCQSTIHVANNTATTYNRSTC